MAQGQLHMDDTHMVLLVLLVPDSSSQIVGSLLVLL